MTCLPRSSTHDRDLLFPEQLHSGGSWAAGQLFRTHCPNAVTYACPFLEDCCCFWCCCLASDTSIALLPSDSESEVFASSSVSRRDQGPRSLTCSVCEWLSVCLTARSIRAVFVRARLQSSRKPRFAPPCYAAVGLTPAGCHVQAFAWAGAGSSSGSESNPLGLEVTVFCRAASNKDCYRHSLCWWDDILISPLNGFTSWLCL